VPLKKPRAYMKEHTSRSKGSGKRERREKSMQSNEKRENGAAQSHAVEEGENGNSASRDADANAAGGASGQLPGQSCAFASCNTSSTGSEHQQ